jgi:hypothetical protein
LLILLDYTEVIYSSFDPVVNGTNEGVAICVCQVGGDEDSRALLLPALWMSTVVLRVIGVYSGDGC